MDESCTACLYLHGASGGSIRPFTGIIGDYRLPVYGHGSGTVNATNYDDGTLLSWNWTDGAQTYMFDIGRVTTDYTYHSDGTVKDVEITAELEPNNLTRLLDASKEP